MHQSIGFLLWMLVEDCLVIVESQQADKGKKTIKECYSHYFFIFLSTLKRKNFLHYIKGILIRKFQSVFFYIKFWQHNLLLRYICSLSRIFALYYLRSKQRSKAKVCGIVSFGAIIFNLWTLLQELMFLLYISLLCETHN